MFLDKNKCMGCNNCQSLCPTKAIKIETINGKCVPKIDSEKCIKCGICEKCCPFDDITNENRFIKTYVGRLKNENLIKESSSGGVFGEIARQALKKGWIVYGAGFNQKFHLEHKRICNTNELSGILKSKYVKSDLANSFELVKNDLENNINVIFSGTPCEIAALKKYLKKDYNNLYTIDLICHGTPKSQIWKKYIEELQKKYNSKIKNIDFRHYDEKEPQKNYLIEFESGEKINMQLYDSVYGKAFLQNMILNDCCYNCNFNNSNNYSDITLGDAHGYINEKYPVKRSLIMIHTEKGNKLFELIKNNLMLFTDFSEDVLVQSNYPIIHSSIPHYNAGNMQIDKNQSIIEGLKLNLDNKYIKMKYNEKNVAILNFHYENYNYGANLVAYSLSKVIENLGYIPYIIDYDPFLPVDKITRLKTKALLDFRLRYLNMTPNIYDGNELKELNKYFDNFIVGSDQVWRKIITKDNMFRYFLDFVDCDKKCIAYGASFGNNNFEGTEEEKEKATVLLKKFNDISVRELDAIDIVKKDFDNDANIVLDPTLLLSKKDYDVFTTQPQKKNYVAYYALFDQEEGFIKKMEGLFPGIDLINIKGNEVEIPFLGKKEFKYNYMEDWISGIRNANFVITDSYHGVLFSLIFNKEFICLGNNSKAKSRFDSLCHILGGNIKERMFSDLDEIKDICSLKELNYQEINENIEKYRKDSIKFLMEALNKKVEINKDSILLNKYINKIEELKKNFNDLNDKNLRDMNSKIINYENNIKELLQHSNNLNVIINNYEKQLNNVTLIKDNIESKIEGFKSSIKQMEEKNKNLEEKNRNLNQQNKDLKNQIDGIYNSRSWKLTKPLRKIVKKRRN